MNILQARMDGASFASVTDTQCIEQTQTLSLNALCLHRLSNVAFAAIHLAPLGLLYTGLSRFDVALCVALYFVRMFFITAGYHRYFSHRAYKMGRFMQFLMALGGSLCANKGVLWWAAHHRNHHRHSDSSKDAHTPQKG
ncbi:MAG: hypothetical protein AAFN74_18400, partial [Myxococcota bacterium]